MLLIDRYCFEQWIKAITSTTDGRAIVNFPISFIRYKICTSCIHDGSAPLAFVFMNIDTNERSMTTSIIKATDLSGGVQIGWQFFTLTAGY